MNVLKFPNGQGPKNPPAISDQITYPPSAIYYDGPSGKYLVDAGQYFRVCGRKAPVVTGVTRYFQETGADPKEAVAAAREAIADAEIDRHVEWSGNLAGHRKGIMQSTDGKPMLVLTSPAIPEPESGPAAVVLDLIRQAFPDQVQRDIFLGWLSGAYRAVRAGIHHPAPMLCLAGPPNAGKSLLAYVVKMILGGRSANPHAAWSGSMGWNDDLFASELLMLDDCQGSTDIRSRMNFAANFKESIYAADVQMRKRHTSSMSARPVWRVMVCCNDTAESLLILPPIGADMADKVALLQISKIVPPVDTGSGEGRAELQRQILAELPMFAGMLERFNIPDELRDSRGGIMAWRHPDLLGAIESMKPESRLEELLETAIATHLFHDLPGTFTASQIESRLTEMGSPVRDQAKALFTWSGAAGTYLGKLADGDSEIINPAATDTHRKVRRFQITRP